MKKILKLIPIIFILSIFLLYISSCSKKDESDSRVEITSDMVYYPKRKDYTGREVKFNDTELYILYNEKYYFNKKAFTVTYSNNIELGEANFTISILEECEDLKGSVSLTFEIVPSSKATISYSYDELIENLKLNSVENNIFTSNSEKSFTIDKDKEVVVADYQTLNIRAGYFYNYGDIIVNGNLTVGGSKTSPYFYNYGNIIVKGTLTFESGSTYNMGNIDCDNIINKARVFTNNEMNLERSTTAGVEYILRKKIDKDFFKLTQPNYYYTGDHIEPKLNTKENIVYDCRYDTNIESGIGKIFVKVKDYDPGYYSDDIVIEFEIKKSTLEVNDVDSLYEGITNTNYDKIIVKSNITVDFPVSVASYKTLSCGSYNLIFEDSLFNYGIIESYAAISIKNEFRNNNYISSKYFSISKENFEHINNGTINTEGFSNYGNFTNDNVIEARHLSNIQNLYNNKTITTSNIQLMANSRFENNGILNLNDGEYDTVIKGTFINNGTFYSKKNIYVENVDNIFINNKEFKNEAIIYTINEIGLENEVVKQKLTSDLFTLEYTSVKYDGAMHKPIVIPNGIDLSDYLISYSYIDKDSSECVDVGTIQVTIKADKLFMLYYGSAILEYTIDYGSYDITQKNGIAKLSNTNYNMFKLEVDIELGMYSNYTIREHQTLDLNHHSLKLYKNSVISNKGKVISRSVDGNEASILITDTARFYNYKELINDGIILDNSKTAALVINNDSTISGSGEMYLDSYYTISSPNVYKREFLNETKTLSLEYTEVLYDNKIKKPVVNCSIEGYDMNNLDITYPEAIYSGVYDIVIKVKSEFDKNYIGEITLQFRINSNILKVNDSNFSESIFDLTTYDRYDATSNITLNKSITIPDHVILNMGIYRFYKNNDIVINTFENTEIWIECNGSNDFLNYHSNVNKITLVADCAYQTMYIEENDFILGNSKDLIFDLNGHNLNASLLIKISKNINLTVTNSSSEKSLIRSNDKFSSLRIYNYVSNNTLNVNNLYFEGLDIVQQTSSKLDASLKDLDIVPANDDSPGLYICGDTKESLYLNMDNVTSRGSTGLYISKGGNINITNSYIFGRKDSLTEGPACYLKRGRSEQENYLVLKMTDVRLVSSYSYGILAYTDPYYRREPANYNLDLSKITYYCKKDDIKLS